MDLFIRFLSRANNSQQLCGPRTVCIVTIMLASLFSAPNSSGELRGGDLANVTLYNPRQMELVNAWGGEWNLISSPGSNLQIKGLSTGERVLLIDLRALKPGEDCCLQCFACGFGTTHKYYQTRDLTSYAALKFRFQNMSSVAMRGNVELKDYRDSRDFAASHAFELNSSTGWQSVVIPLNLADAAWKMTGRLNISRILTIDVHLQPQSTFAGGQLQVSDVMLEERGGPLEIETSPSNLLVERLARRQWLALWSTRSREHGMIPNNSYQSTDAGLNTTAAVLWTLPSATRHHWVAREDADRYVTQLVHSDVYKRQILN